MISFRFFFTFYFFFAHRDGWMALLGGPARNGTARIRVLLLFVFFGSLVFVKAFDGVRRDEYILMPSGNPRMSHNSTSLSFTFAFSIRYNQYAQPLNILRLEKNDLAHTEKHKCMTGVSVGRAGARWWHSNAWALFYALANPIFLIWMQTMHEISVKNNRHPGKQCWCLHWFTCKKREGERGRWMLECTYLFPYYS